MDTNTNNANSINLSVENDLAIIKTTGDYRVYISILEKYEEEFRGIALEKGCIPAKYWENTPSALGGFWSGCDIFWDVEGQFWRAPDHRRGTKFLNVASFVNSWFRTEKITKHLLKLLQK